MKSDENHPGQSCACFCLGPSALSELSPTPSMRPRLQTALMAAGSFSTFFFSKSSVSSTAGVVAVSFLSWLK